jgi:hypothetical protein
LFKLSGGVTIGTIVLINAERDNMFMEEDSIIFEIDCEVNELHVTRGRFMNTKRGSNIISVSGKGKIRYLWMEEITT